MNGWIKERSRNISLKVSYLYYYFISVFIEYDIIKNISLTLSNISVWNVYFLRKSELQEKRKVLLITDITEQYLVSKDLAFISTPNKS